MAAKETTEGGMGLGTILFIVFLILKLCNVIDWSWWWVTAPLWIPFALIIVFLLITIIFCLCSSSFRRDFVSKIDN